MKPIETIGIEIAIKHSEAGKNKDNMRAENAQGGLAGRQKRLNFLLTF